VNEIKAKYPKITIVDIQYGGGDQLKSADIAKSMIRPIPISRVSLAPTKALPRAS